MKFLGITATFAAAAAFAGCRSMYPAPGTPATLDSTDAPAAASAVMRSSTGQSLGTVTISETGNALSVSGTLNGLAPGVHAVHLHAKGTCAAPSFESAGGHWNPTARLHGEKNPQGPHKGDLQNVMVGTDSTARLSLRASGATLRGADGLLDDDGAALVIHASADDERTDPTGNAGNRIACGTVTPE